MKLRYAFVLTLSFGLLLSCQDKNGISPFFSGDDSSTTTENSTNSTQTDDDTAQVKQQYLLGTGLYDITGPAAEVGMMGYSMPDQKTSGIQMRLRSRAYIIGETDSDKRVVFVSAEICMIFQSVKQKVSSMIKSNPELSRYYNEKNVVLSATHTHSGPGGYSHYTTYNLSVLGFIKQNFDAICNGIYNSILYAHRNLEPGYIYVNKGELDNCGWNRSIDAYNNDPQEERNQYNSSTDKTMTLLKLVAVDGREIGMINWFAVHPTSIGNTNHLITSDNKGLATYLFEKDKQTDYSSSNTFTAAFAQTNSGDVSPNIAFGYPQGGDSDYEHMDIIASRQYQKAVELYNNASETLSGSIDYRHSYVDFTQVELDPFWANGETGRHTCKAAIGYTQIAGSSEDGAGVDIAHEGMVWNVDWPAFTLVPELQACHQEKIILLPAGDMKPYPWIPQILPIQIVKIGNLALIAMPAEVTTMAGRRLRKTVIDELSGLNVNYLVISSHSNAYTSYVTTREEYATQQYEGGSTEFGPYTLNAYQQSFANLANAMRNSDSVDSGPTPADLSGVQNNLQTAVVFDDIPLFKHFGDIYSNANSSYQRGSRVKVIFWGGHPKNNLRIQNTFLKVEKNSGGQWTSVAQDWDPETRYIWKRDGIAYSKITIEWRIPADAAPGTYRIRHFGDWKSGWTGKVSSYSGTSRSFTVN